MAGELDVDLVGDRGSGRSPVVPLDGLRQVKYQEQKRAAEAKSKQKYRSQGVKFRPGTDEAITRSRWRNLRRFIEEDGDKAR